MLEKISEKNVWDYLKEAELPIVLYGMGNGTDMIINKLNQIGVSFSDIFASDEFVRGQSFHGFRVKNYEEILEEFDDFIIVMGFAVHDDKTLEKVRNLSGRHQFFAPNVPIVNDGVFTREFIEEHESEFDNAYELLADDFSRQSYIDILNFKVSGKIEYLFKCQKNKSDVYTQYLNVGSEEVFMDLGAYDGDTIREFLSATGGKYKKIYAVEADEKNYKKLADNIKNSDNTEAYNLAAWDKKETLFFEKKKGRNSKLSCDGMTEITANSVDNIRSGREITILKMDIEGSEMKALCGAVKTIEKYTPRLYICAYHRNEDMYALPLKIHELNKNYKIYFCHHPYIPAWESNFYCNIEHQALM